LRLLNYPIGKETIMQAEHFEDVLRFWFPIQPNDGLATIVRQFEWWFRGGANDTIIQHFSPLFAQAIRGELDAWANQARSRLALIIVLDQFSRSLHQGTAQAFAQDPKAVELAIVGLDRGHYDELDTPWEKTFFLLPLGHSEELSHVDWAVKLAEELAQNAPDKYRSLLAFSAEQARGHQAVVAQFGRQPHRNEVLGRRSTLAELEYLATGNLVHTRPMPPHLAQYSFGQEA
jgi:uncharacterized protein (DUF924 family)